jgi:hypothetical protein
MAIIKPYVAHNIINGSDLQLRVKKLIWLTVGKGMIRSISDYEVAVMGKISFLGFKGDLNVLIQLVDRSPGTGSGPCIMEFNIHRDENAVYATNNGVLTVDAILGGEKQRITLSRFDKGQQTKCHLKGYVNETTYLKAV